MKYFSYDPLFEGFDLYNTAEEAKNAAQESISKYIEDEGWDDHVELVCWGEIKQIATQTDTCTHDDCTSDIHPNCRNYTLKNTTSGNSRQKMSEDGSTAYFITHILKNN